MKKLFMITGATGHLGSVLVRELLSRGEAVRVFALPGEETFIPDEAEAFYGDVTDAESMRSFFETEENTYRVLIHCAGIVTIATKEDPRVYAVNVLGTKHMLALAGEYHIDRVIYVSTVHAIPEKPGHLVIQETDSFSPLLVKGQYAKSKAQATALALQAAKAGLPLSVVHPSGIIGPGDLQNRNHSQRTIQSFADGKIPVVISGGYDFVDVRDVANGICDCVDHGKTGSCYILSGHYVLLSELQSMIYRIKGKKLPVIRVPYRLLWLLAAVIERFIVTCLRRVPILSPYALSTLHSNGNFSHAKATKEWGYQPRPLEETIKDSLP